MVTALLLLPVVCVLIWVYGYLLPQRWAWSRFDLGLIVLALALAAGWTGWMRTAQFDGGGPIFGHLAAMAGAYPIVLACLAAGVGWRRRAASR
jgi:hypothetical protein